MQTVVVFCFLFYQRIGVSWSRLCQQSHLACGHETAWKPWSLYGYPPNGGFPFGSPVEKQHAERVTNSTKKAYAGFVFVCIQAAILARSPSSALLPFLLRKVPLQQKKIGPPCSNLSTGGPRVSMFRGASVFGRTPRGISARSSSASIGSSATAWRGMSTASQMMRASARFPDAQSLWGAGARWGFASLPRSPELLRFCRQSRLYSGLGGKNLPHNRLLDGVELETKTGGQHLVDNIF